MKDDLGDRMKASYENRTRYYLPRRTYTIIRVDGKAFHSYTRDCDRPFDFELMDIMDRTARDMCSQIEGVQLAYIQSDEISFLLTDFESPQTQAWFGGNLQKLCSLSASIATSCFNVFASKFKAATSPACFDARVFTIPDPVEVENYFVWRQQDAVRNSIQMAGQANFSHSQLQGVSGSQIQEMLLSQKGINWNNYPDGAKRGRCIVKSVTTKPVEYTDKRTGDLCTTDPVERHFWEVVSPPVFTQERDWLSSRIPRRP